VITVRFPNGHTLTYNSAGYIDRYTERTDLYTRENGAFLAQVPNSCVIEFEKPCRVYNALQENSLEALTKEVRALRRKMRGKRSESHRR